MAKLHKLGERAATAEARPDRLIAKDAADAYRLMLHIDPATAIERLKALSAHATAGRPTQRAIDYLEDLFIAPAARGVRLAVEGLSTDVPAARVEAVCVGFTGSVIERWHAR